MYWETVFSRTEDCIPSVHKSTPLVCCFRSVRGFVEKATVYPHAALSCFITCFLSIVHARRCQGKKVQLLFIRLVQLCDRETLKCHTNLGIWVLCNWLSRGWALILRMFGFPRNLRISGYSRCLSSMPGPIFMAYKFLARKLQVISGRSESGNI